MKVAPIVERNADLAPDLGVDPADVVAPRQFPIGKPCGDALKPRPPQRPRLGPLHQRRKIFLADAAQRQRRLGGQCVGIGLGEFAERFMDRRAAIGRRQRHVDGIERIEPQDIFRIDRIGIAQPVLDRRHRQFQRPRRARRFWRGLLDRLDLCRAGRVRRRSGHNSRPPRSACFQRSSPATASSRCRKREATAGAPPTFAEWVRMTSSWPSSCAKSCAERPMRRSGRSRPSSCRIGRLSHGSIRGAGGHTPSTSPPRMTRSDSVKRASSWP